MPVRGAATRAEQRATLARIAHQKFTAPEVGKLLDELRGWGEQQRLRLARGEPDPGRLARLGQGAPRPGRSPRRHVARRVARPAGVGRGAQEQRLRDLRPGAPREPRPAEALRRVLRRLRRAVRRAARRLRAADEDGHRPSHLRLPEGAPGAAREGGRRAPRPRAPAGARVPARPAEPVRARGAATSSASPRTPGGSTRPCTRSRPGTGINDIRVTTRYFPNNLDGLFATMHEFGHGLYEHQVDEALERTPLARGVSLGHARVAEPDVGEPRRPVAAVLARLLPAAAGDVPGRARRLGRRELVPRGERRRAVADPRRGRRGDLQPAHHPALRARAGAARRLVPARAAARGVEPPRLGVPRHRGAGRHARRAAGRALVGRQHRLLLDLRARQSHLAPDLGEGHRRPAVARSTASSRASSARCATGSASTCIATAASSRRPRRSSGSSGTSEIDPEPYVRYLRDKLVGLYGISATA